MPDSRFPDEVVLATFNDQPREPDAWCEGCGVRGTVGRATRAGEGGEPVEEHRYCARCWPEWSAFYRARWYEEVRDLTLQTRSRREPPSRQALARVADGIRAG